MIQSASVKTNRAERLLKALCNHFSRKTTAAYEENIGYIEFSDGRCDITATTDALELQVQAETSESVERLTDVVGRHLLRFSPEEELQIEWIIPS